MQRSNADNFARRNEARIQRSLHEQLSARNTALTQEKKTNAALRNEVRNGEEKTASTELTGDSLEAKTTAANGRPRHGEHGNDTVSRGIR